MAAKFVDSGLAPLLAQLAQMPIGTSSTTLPGDVSAVAKPTSENPQISFTATECVDDLHVRGLLRVDNVEARLLALQARLALVSAAESRSQAETSTLPTMVFLGPLTRGQLRGSTEIAVVAASSANAKNIPAHLRPFDDSAVLRGKQHARVSALNVWIASSSSDSHQDAGDDTYISAVQFLFLYSHGDQPRVEGGIHGEAPNAQSKLTTLTLGHKEFITALDMSWSSSSSAPASFGTIAESSLRALRVKTSDGQEWVVGLAPKADAEWSAVALEDAQTVKGWYGVLKQASADKPFKLCALGPLLHKYKSSGLSSSSSSSSAAVPAAPAAIVAVASTPMLKHVSDFDENGLMYWLGTKGKTTAWQNPHTLGAVTVECSKIKSDSKPVDVRFRFMSFWNVVNHFQKNMWLFCFSGRCGS